MDVRDCWYEIVGTNYNDFCRMNTVILSIVAFLFAIGVLVAVHEGGHYNEARIRAEEHTSEIQ